MDAEDGKRYNKILHHLELNQNDLEHQLRLQYSFNKYIVQNFNKTIQNINHNEHLLASKIYQLNNFIRNQTHNNAISVAKDFMNQLIIVYNILNYILQDVVNSLTFCKLRVMHPSIIKPAELFFHLKEISHYYKTQLPFETKYENLLDFESLIKINCKISPHKIIYFLSIPINFEKDFELYELLSIPTQNDVEYVTIIPKNKYFLKSKFNEIIPMNDICPKNNNYYQCPSQLQANTKPVCEEEILNKGTSNSCNYTSLTIEEGHLEILNELNQYLAIFPKEEKIALRCSQGSETKTLQGIFLIKEDQCEIYFKNRKLSFQDTSFGKPDLVNPLDLNIRRNQISDFKINLKTLKTADVYPNFIFKKPEELTLQIWRPSVWTIILYVIALLIMLYFSRRCLKKKFQSPSRDPTGETSSRVPNSEETALNLPGDACF